MMHHITGRAEPVASKDCVRLECKHPRRFALTCGPVSRALSLLGSAARVCESLELTGHWDRSPAGLWCTRRRAARKARADLQKCSADLQKCSAVRCRCASHALRPCSQAATRIFHRSAGNEVRSVLGCVSLAPFPCPSHSRPQPAPAARACSSGKQSCNLRK
jgi:hypothetical protein